MHSSVKPINKLDEELKIKHELYSKISERDYKQKSDSKRNKSSKSISYNSTKSIFENKSMNKTVGNNISMNNINILKNNYIASSLKNSKNLMLSEKDLKEEINNYS